MKHKSKQKFFVVWLKHLNSNCLHFLDGVNCALYPSPQKLSSGVFEIRQNDHNTLAKLHLPATLLVNRKESVLLSYFPV